MTHRQPVQAAPTAFASWQTESGTYLLVLLFLVSVMNFLDRQVLSIVQEDIKLELTLTDGQLGFLALGFGVTNALFALPIGRLADRIPRKTVLVSCLALWSSVTALCGLVTNFSQLLVARMGVALGEAGVTPTTYSLISDKYPLKRRATAIAVCSAGVPVGLMLSLFLGGLIADNFGWRWTFVLFGLPGILLATIFVLTVKAPGRGQADGIRQVRETNFVDSFLYLMRTPTFALIVAGSAFKSIGAYGIVQWIPTFYIRKFDLTPGEAGMSLGPILGVVGLVSLVGAAYIADRLSEKDVRWYSWILGGTQIFAFPFTAAALWSGDYALSLFFFSCAILSGNSMLAITNSLVQSSAPVQMRGVASATKTVALSFIGYGIGGALIGQLSDVFATDVPGEGLGVALTIASVTYLVAALLFWLSAHWVTRDVAGAQKASGQAEPRTV